MLVRLAIRPRLVLTGQHPGLRPADYGMPDLPAVELGCRGVADPNVHAGLVARSIRPALEGTRLVVAQGDTSSALGGALAAAQAGVAVAHVESGLRSHDRLNPWPEEEFRIAIDAVATLLFAPTQLNSANLRREGLAGQVIVTGNTGIDALFGLLPLLSPRTPGEGKRRILVTCHRRESWGEALEDIASSLVAIGRRKDVAITMVLHPNPRVADEMRRLLRRTPNIEMRPPCGHLEMLQRMRDSDLILSDSGGMQEEAPALGIPLLILRDRTERPEGLASGSAVLVGRNAERIVAAVEMLLDSEAALEAMSTPTFPYGDGLASERIAAAIEDWLSEIRPFEPRLPSPPSETAPGGQ